MTGKLEGLIQRLTDLFRHGQSTLRIRDIMQQDHKLIPADPANRIGFTHTTQHPAGDLFQQPITDCMPECVIDRLEFIQIKKHQRQIFLVPFC